MNPLDTLKKEAREMMKESFGEHAECPWLDGVVDHIYKQAVEDIIKAVENGYYDDMGDRGKTGLQYPPFELTAFADRPVYHQYVIHKIKSLTPKHRD